MDGPLTRGKQLAAFVHVLREWGDLERVVAVLPPETKSLVRKLPQPSDWIPLQHNVNIFVAVEALLGRDRVRTMARAAARPASSEYVLSFIERVLQGVGASPASLLSLANVALRFHVRGVDFAYTAWTSTSGALELRLSGMRAPPAFFEAWAGVIEHALHLCGVQGTVEVHRRDEGGDNAAGVLRVAWT